MFGEQGLRSGERARCYKWFEFVLGSRLAPEGGGGGGVRVLQFSSLNNINSSKFQFDQDREPS